MPRAGQCRAQVVPCKYKGQEVLVHFLVLPASSCPSFPGRLGHAEETLKEPSWQGVGVAEGSIQLWAQKLALTSAFPVVLGSKHPQL